MELFPARKTDKSAFTALPDRGVSFGAHAKVQQGARRRQEGRRRRNPEGSKAERYVEDEEDFIDDGEEDEARRRPREAEERARAVLAEGEEEGVTFVSIASAGMYSIGSV